MRTDMYEEQAIKKSFDMALMKRLFKFTRPFMPLLMLCVVLLFFITAVDLARPYLIKIVIDDYITAWREPMYAFDYKVDGLDSTEFDGHYYVREETLTKSLENNSEKDVANQHENFTARVEYARQEGVPWALDIDLTARFQLITLSDDHYLVHGILPDSVQTSDLELSGLTLGAEDFQAKVTPLTQEAYGAFRAQDNRGILKIIQIFTGMLFAGFLMNYIQTLLLNHAAQRQIFNMRQALFEHLLGQNLAFYDKTPVGRLVTRVTNDMKNISEMYTSVLINALKDFLLLIGTIFVMFSLNPMLTLISLLTSPLIAFAAWRFRMKARAAHRAVKVKIAKINASLSENIAGMRLIQIFDQQKKTRDAFSQINDDHLQATMQEIRVFAIFRPAMNLIYSLTLALLIWYGGGRAIQGTLELGVLFAFINYTEQFYRPIFDLSEKFNILQSAMASAERVFLLLDTKNVIPCAPNPQKLDAFKGEIEFKNVWFSYEPDNWVLKDVSFKVEPGSTVAFVGATGSGKTTIISLLNRFYDIQKGEILIDGKDIKTLDLKDLRSKIGIVLQDVFLFAGDIKGNIRLNQSDMPLDCLESVARHVNADPFIKKLPSGYDEPVHERGSTLSAGQRQLLSFARALAFSPDLLILDEATANIDTETELLIQDAIDKIVKNRTTIVVAHRLSTIQSADKIIVLHKGEIREMGTHNTLLDQQGIYYNLFLLQYQ